MPPGFFRRAAAWMRPSTTRAGAGRRGGRRGTSRSAPGRCPPHARCWVGEASDRPERGTSAGREAADKPTARR